MLSSSEAAANKKAALEQLRFNKKPQAGPLNSSASSLASSSNQSPLTFSPPPQSRDATISSRFFPTTPNSIGTILVPNSSPLSSDANYAHYLPYSQPNNNDVAAQSFLSYANPWNLPSRERYSLDSLTSTSGFATNGMTSNATLRRPWCEDDGRIDSMQHDGPARKKVNLGPSDDPTNLFNTPNSPDVQRPAARRRIVNEPMDSLSHSSDDSMPDVSQLAAGPSKPRIVRGRPSGSPKPQPIEPSFDHKFYSFQLTMPMEDPTRVRAAWVQASGDVRKATELLSDPRWGREPVKPLEDTNMKVTNVFTQSSQESAKPYDEDTGKVKEIQEAMQARRAADREKGKKSMIYANRSILENKPATVSTPPPAKVDIDLTSSALPPIIRPPQRKRAKKAVVGSDSELELTDSEDENSKKGRDEATLEKRVLDYFNASNAEALQELTGCTLEQANTIIGLRRFDSVDDLNTKLGQGKKKAGPAGISPRMFEDCTAIFKGYGIVDSILEDCEEIGANIRVAIAQWTSASASIKGKEKEELPTTEAEDGSLSLRTLTTMKEKKPKDFLVTQPSLLSDKVQLKEYQLLGVNWLYLLYRSKLSCILADEMGLGKTVQVISFFAHLKERGKKGPHLIVVPSSTLENWCREFARFAPSIQIQTYYAGKEERPVLRQTLLDTQRSTSKNDDGWEVLITTYNLAQGDEKDRKFFRRIEWDCCVFDEGHVLKNFQSQRYQALLKFNSTWRLLLTGTPLQNNLQELVSLMNFILPDHFAEAMGDLRAIFKVKGDSKVTLLAQERVSRAKKMMTPFVLRRRKDQVLKDLPKKTERIEWCEMTRLQQNIYTDVLQRSRKTILDTVDGDSAESSDKTVANGRGASKKDKAKTKWPPKEKVSLENSSNVLMDLRKAASHPMLFRTLFTNDILTGMTKQLLKEPDFKKRGALFDLVKEDMSVMTDAELQVFSAMYKVGKKWYAPGKRLISPKSTRKYLQDDKCYYDAGKVVTLLHLLEGYKQEGRKTLIFSQFTQVLDILQAVLKQKEIKYLLLTGSTPVDVRQTLVDEFTEDESIPVFLLSTKAGGMGINLAAASVVIMFDQDFNPHNDRQAQDRAYRIGQKRDVEVVKLISRGTIEEDMLKLGETKLALDEAVAGDNDEKSENAQEKEMRMSLMNVLRQQFEKQHIKDSCSQANGS